MAKKKTYLDYFKDIVPATKRSIQTGYGVFTNPQSYRDVGQFGKESIYSGLDFGRNIAMIPTGQEVAEAGKYIYNLAKPKEPWAEGAMKAIKAKTGKGVSMTYPSLSGGKLTTKTAQILPSNYTSGYSIDAGNVTAQKQVPKTNITSGYSFDAGNVTAPGQIGTPTTKMAQTQGGGIQGVTTQGVVTQGVGTQQPVAQPPLDLANEEKYLRGILKDENADPALKNWAVQQAQQYGIDITQPTLEELREQAKTEREKFIESGLQSELTGLEAQRQRALGTLEQQRGLIAPQYEALRTQAATRAMQQARNFAEYMGARGALTGGAAAQAEIQRGAELQGRFGEIGLAEQQAIQSLENKKSEVQLDFDTRISQAKTQAERDKQEFELSQRLDEISRIENEMMQKIENARILEEEKIKAAAASAKDEADYQRKRELIQFQTNEDIRLAQEKAKFESTSEDKRKFSDIPEYQTAINLVRKGILPIGEDGKEKQLTSTEIQNGEYVNFLLNNYEDIIQDLTVNGYEALLKEAIKYSKQNINSDAILSEILSSINQ